MNDIHLENELFSAPKVREANEMWADICETHEGQIVAVEAAKTGDSAAIIYIAMENIRQIGQVFWKNYLGPNSKARKVRIENGAVEDFCSLAREVLFSTGPGSPFHTFDPYRWSDTTDIIFKAGRYIQQYLEQASISENKRNAKQGLGGNIPEDAELIFMDYDMLSNSSDVADALQTVPHDMLIEAEDAWDAFCRKAPLDDVKAPTYRDILKEFLNQEGKFDVKAAVAKFGVSNLTIRNRLEQLQALLEEFDIDSATFLILLSRIGKHTLLSSL